MNNLHLKVEEDVLVGQLFNEMWDLNVFNLSSVMKNS